MRYLLSNNAVAALLGSFSSLYRDQRYNKQRRVSTFRINYHSAVALFVCLLLSILRLCTGNTPNIIQTTLVSDSYALELGWN